MASLSRRRLILDSGGVSAIADGNPVARATVARARNDGYLVAIPTPAVTEVHTGRREHALIDRVLKAVDHEIPSTPRVARLAGVLRAKSGVTDVVDAIVVAEAIESTPAIVLTSDPTDISRLLDVAEVPKGQVVVVAV